MVILGTAGDDTVMEKVNALLLQINREGVYAKYFDDALMLAEKMRLF